MYFALSEVCEFAALPEYLVGFRQAAGSQSTDIDRMAESIDCVIQWLTERWPLSEDLRRERIYDSNLWLAQRALDNNQFGKALYYRANAVGLLDLSNVMFASRIFFRMVGLTRTNFRRRGWTFKPPTYFQDAIRSWN